MTELDRRSLLLAGAGVVTVAPLAVFSPAAARRSRTKVFKGRFTSPDTQDWHYLPFRVPRGVRRISVKYRYTPTDTGIGISYNVVDIGIFDPSGHGLGDERGFRGWSGGARRSFSISRSRATPGRGGGSRRCRPRGRTGPTAGGVTGCVGQLLGPAGILAGAVATGDSLTVSAELPAASLAYVRGEVRRQAVVTDPLTSLSALPMVAMTNPVFVTAPGGA